MKIHYDKIKTVIKSHKKQLADLGTRHLAIFGSAVTGNLKKGSDIDILVDFDPKKGLFGFADLKFFLEKILGTDVDLVSIRALHPALKKRILNEAKKIF